ncbi:hypothetical protein TNCV_2390851 [Trichonephila clavipes]|nr:hypothetical protein TNCV_2390851 [Trichonephila clavipes]
MDRYFWSILNTKVIGDGSRHVICYDLAIPGPRASASLGASSCSRLCLRFKTRQNSCHELEKMATDTSRCQLLPLMTDFIRDQRWKTPHHLNIQPPRNPIQSDARNREGEED